MSNKTEILSVSIVKPYDKNIQAVIQYRSIEFLYLIEDIFSFSITGKLRFRDIEGIVEKFPLSGNEKVFISYGNSKGDRYTVGLVMDIFKIDTIKQGKVNDPTGGSVVELTLVDERFMAWGISLRSRSWVNLNTGNIIKDICKDYIGITDYHNFEPTRERLEHFDTHNRTVSECVEWLMNRSSSYSNKTAGYLLYTTTMGKGKYGVNFTTLESLLSNTKYMQPEGDNFVYNFESQNQNYINKIKYHEMFKVDLNALRTISGGKVLGYDIKRKKLIERSYNYKDAISKYTVLGKKTLFPENFNVSDTSILMDGYHNEDILDNIWYGNWIKEYCNQQLLDIVVVGHEDRYAGGIINVQWPSVDEKNLMFHNQFRGKYLVKSITNIFGEGVEEGWSQKLTLIKNGYTDSPNTSLLSASKTNLVGKDK